MDINNTNSQVHLDIIHNILADNELKSQCIQQIKSYEETQNFNINNTLELLRFSRDISMEAFFNNNDSEQLETNENMKKILSELSFFSDDNNENTDNTVVLLQLSSLLDNFFKQLSTNELKLYIYRYFFAYPIETVATICNTQVTTVEKAISSCNNNLKNILISEKIECNSRQLLLSFIDIHDNYLSIIKDKELEKITTKIKDPSSKKKSGPTLKVWLNIAFAILIVGLASVNIYLITKTNKSTPKVDEKAANASAFNIESAYKYVDNKKMANVETLINYQDYDNSYFSSLNIFIDKYIGYYYSLELISDINLEDFLGETITNVDHYYFDDSIYFDSVNPSYEQEIPSNNVVFYKLLGMDSIEYIIIESDNTYKLFYLMSYGLDDVSKDKIDCMEAQKYFYGFTSVNHINNITVAAGDPDTGFADGYTRKIIDDEDNVQKIYKILSSSYCIEETVNDLIFSDNFRLSYLLENSMQVSIEGKDGSTSYSLYYYPSGHFFYEISNDLIYMVESENDIKYLAEIFKINRHTEPSDPETWNLTLSCYEATESYVSLSIAPDANRNYYNLYMGADYTIEKLENDTWTNCPTKLGYQLYSDTYPFSTKISNSSTTMYTDFFTEEKYGRLQKGTYRITITVYDSNSTDLTNPSHRDFTTEFTIE
ncbi:MAG: immunoglobulin-like domain-containing protein [Lachnospiraceae bacterium]|nr:immunoglobulin-like domain-containing protein [Lachnospiraceae bacterium]